MTKVFSVNVCYANYGLCCIKLNLNGKTCIADVNHTNRGTSLSWDKLHEAFLKTNQSALTLMLHDLCSI